jgi:probable rRNA maturation factor
MALKKSSKPKTPSKMVKKTKTAAIAVRIEENAWQNEKPALTLMRRAARQALKHATPTQRKKAAPFTLLLTSDGALKAMNAQFRGKNKPTNVLSFPGLDSDYLGDIAIAYGVTAREAKTAKKPFAHHAAHLAAHGVLHLLGYDHEEETEADHMESIETRLLDTLNIPDPYRVSSRAKR